MALNRLRKEAAFHRLLTRLQEAASETWVLKGGLALLTRVGAHVRGTKDIDANWRASNDELEDVLDAVDSSSSADWFDFPEQVVVLVVGGSFQDVRPIHSS